MKTADITLLTEERYLNPSHRNEYINNILLEDEILTKSLESRGLKIHREKWSEPDYDWSSSQYLMFRTTWDYFDRFNEFADWLKKIPSMTTTINDVETVEWNLDKKYLLELQEKGVRIPDTILIQNGTEKSLGDYFRSCGWPKAVLKPCISAAASNTFVIDKDNVGTHEQLFRELIKKENFLLQEFQENVLSKGELSVMFFGDHYSHTILKKAKPGDFRVQDDFGGSVHAFEATPEIISFSENVLDALDESPTYSRIDLMWNNQNQLVLTELELIEPELWFRFKPESANLLADLIIDRYFK